MSNTPDSLINHLGADPYTYKAVSPTEPPELKQLPETHNILAAVGIPFVDDSFQLGQNLVLDLASNDPRQNRIIIEAAFGEDEDDYAASVLDGGLKEIVDSTLLPALTRVEKNSLQVIGGLVIHRQNGPIETDLFVASSFISAMERETRDRILRPRGIFRNLGELGLQERRQADRFDRIVHSENPARFHSSLIKLSEAIVFESLPTASALRQEFMAQLPEPERLEARRPLRAPSRERRPAHVSSIRRLLVASLSPSALP